MSRCGIVVMVCGEQYHRVAKTMRYVDRQYGPLSKVVVSRNGPVALEARVWAARNGVRIVDRDGDASTSADLVVEFGEDDEAILSAKFNDTAIVKASGDTPMPHHSVMCGVENV